MLHRCKVGAATAMMVALVVVPGAAAAHCNGPYLTVELGTKTMYVEERDTGEYRLVVYLESNGVEGLQTGADYLIEPNPIQKALYFLNTDSCFHDNPDVFLVGIP